MQASQARHLAAVGALALAAGRGANAQTQSVTRSAAVASAVAHGPRVAIARADSAAASAQLMRARQYDNPILGLSYTKAVPTQHIALDLPLDFPWFRNPRIGFAQAGLDAASLRFAFEREVVAFDADTTYTQALATAARARLSRATARDADSLLAIARIRRDAGDGSELDVQLASLSAGAMANAASSDSLDAITALLAVQAAMGLTADAPSIALADSLAMPPLTLAGSDGTPLLIQVAEREAHAADLGIALERRQRFATPSLSFGFDQHDPAGQGNGVLPMIGISLPLPVLNQNGAGVQLAQAEQSRAQAELSLARIETNAALARARREFTVARSRASRSADQVATANRVAALSLVSYRDGGAPLASVLESQRMTREALVTYLNDVADARNAASLVHLLQQTSTSVTNRPNR